MKCPRCDAEITTTGKFCTNCGENISFLQVQEALSRQPPKPASPAGAVGSSPEDDEKFTAAGIKRLNESFSGLLFVKSLQDNQALARIRARLAAWANTIPNHGIRNFGDAIEPVALTEISAYRINLITTCESRGSFDENIKPYEGEPLSSVPVVKKKANEIWEFPSNITDEMFLGEKVCPVVASYRKQKCFECRGNGKMICDRCNGNKTLECPECEGMKRKRCEKCRGAGKIRCWTCNGSGRLSVPGTGSSSEQCFDCTGEGSLPCKSCNDGFNPCGHCSSLGSLGCPSCGGDGNRLCGKCNGKKELLNYLSFNAVRSSVSGTRVVAAAALPRTFPKQYFDKLENSTRVGSATVKNFPESDILSTDIDSRFVTAVSEMDEAAKAGVRDNALKRIVLQKVMIDRFIVQDLLYRLAGREYHAYLYGEKDELFIEDNPIHDIQSSLIDQIGQALRKGDFKSAQECIDRILRIDPRHQKALAYRVRIRKGFFTAMVAGGLMGGILAGTVAGGIIAYLRRASLNYFFTVAQIGLLSIVIGTAMGFLVAFVRSRAVVMRPVKKRIPFLIAFCVPIGFFAVIVFAFKYDPITQRDIDQFHREFNQGLPFGIPSVPHEADIHFLGKLIKKFKPTGIDVSKASKGLKKLQVFKAEQEKEERLKTKRQKKRKAAAAKKARARKAKARNRAAFDKEMDRYETLVLRKQLKKRKQRISFLENLIRKYRGKGIDVSPAQNKLDRLQKKKKKKKKR